MAEKEKKDKEEVIEEEEGGGEKPKKGKKLLLIIIVLVLLLGGGGAGLYFSGMIGGKKEESADGKEPKEDGHGAKKEESGGHGEKKSADGGHGEGGGEAAVSGPIYMELPAFLVNLNTGGTGTSFLKMTVTLEVPSDAVAQKVESIKPRIMDNFNTYLRELRASDLSGSAGLYRLKEELLMRINKALAPDQVTDILFKEIIVQ